MNFSAIGYRFVILGLCAGTSATASGDARSDPLRVVDSAGQGIAGAAVVVYRIPVTRSPVERAGARISATTSGEDGSIDGPLPAVAELVVTVDHPHFAPRVAAGASDSFRVVRLEPGRSWSGRVRAADSRPVATGRVCVSFAIEADRLHREVDFERCAAIEAGRFTVEGLPEDISGRLRITAPGFLPATSTYPLPAGHRLVLEPGFVISGRVVGAIGEGLPGAQIAVLDGESTESVAEGEFAVRAPLLPAELTFRARGHHQKALTLAAVDPDEPLVVPLTPGPTLAVRLVGSDGRRPEGVEATVLRYQPERAEWRTAVRAALAARPPAAPAAAPAVGDDVAEEAIEAAELDLDLPGEGEYRLVVEARGHGRHHEPTFAVGPAGHVDLGLIHLSQGAGVTARVEDSLSGEPVPRVLGQLSPTGTAGVLELVGGGASAEVSDAEGHLHIVGQEAGIFELQLSHREYATRIVEVELEREEIRDLGSIWLGPGTEVAGRVADRSGKPRPGLQVRIVGSAVGSLAAVAERTTGADGRFAPARLGAGEYRIEVHGSHLLLDQGLSVAEGEPGIDLDLTVGGTHWRGRVYRGQRPVTGGSLLVRPLSDTAHQRGRVMVAAPGMEPQLLGGSGGASSATVDREGHFELVDAPTGVVLATFLGNDGPHARERLFVPPEAEVWQDIRLTDAALDGSVLDAESGMPLAGARLRLRDPLLIVVAEAVSGEDGTFRLTGFDLASSYQLEAELEGYRPRLLGGVVVEERDSPLQVLLEPAASSSLLVRLERGDGSRAARATISLFSEGGWMLRSLMLDSYGEIVFDDLAAGRYFVLWHDPLTGTGVSSPIEVGADAPSRFARVLQPGAPLTLECGESCAGNPLPAVAVLSDSGVEITSHLPAISPALRFSPTGLLVLGNLQPGRYVIRSWLGGLHRDVSVTARPGEPVAVALGQ